MIGYDPATKKWTPVKQVSKTGTSATFEVPHFSTWAFAIRNTAATPQPAAPVATPAAPAASPTAAPAQAATPAAGSVVPPGAVVPRPANTGTGLFSTETGTNSMLLSGIVATVVLGLAGGAVMMARRRA